MTVQALTEATVLRGRSAVLDSVSMQVAAGELVGVVGANGSGKTTLIRAALGLLPLAAGEATLGDRKVAELSSAERAARAAYLPQERRVGWNMSARAIAALGAPRVSPQQAHGLARSALGRVGLRGLEGRGVLDLSGGERARVLLARLLVSGGPFLAADEPGAGLDPDAQLLAMELLREEATRGAGVLVTLHDLGLAARSCDRIIVLKAGRIVADAPPAAALSPAVLADAFNLDGALETTAGGLVLVARRRA